MNWLFIVVVLFSFNSSPLLPIDVPDRTDPRFMQLTEIGDFGVMRKERETVPAHLHTGIDIRRPTNNYMDEPIYSIADGVVISIRRDGPYAQIIVEHQVNGRFFWSLYEHIAGITVSLHDEVSSSTEIARFFSRKELDHYGWQFDHFHFEVIKREPIRLAADTNHPERHFASYTLQCKTQSDLDRYYYEPVGFFK
jgi:hypothetical protein